MTLYEFAVIYEGIKRKESDGGGYLKDKEPRVVERGDFLASDENQATIKAGRLIPESLMEELDRITIAVRPF